MIWILPAAVFYWVLCLVLVGGFVNANPPPPEVGPVTVFMVYLLAPLTAPVIFFANPAD